MTREKSKKPRAQPAIESPAATARRPAAQSAMEFLMTYGWAILVIIMVIAVLFYVGILNPRTVQANTCIFNPGHTCYSFKIATGSGAFILDYGQATGRTILITGASCSENASAPIVPLMKNVTVPSGEHRWVLGGDSENKLNCTDEMGNNLSSPNVGDMYKGKVCINYTEMDTGYSRIVCGDVNGRFDVPGSEWGGDGGIVTPTPTPSPGGTPAPTATTTQTPTPTPTPIGTVTPIPIVRCGQSINSPGNYVLTRDLYPGINEGCIEVGVNDVYIDCAGNAIYCMENRGSQGIMVNSRDNVTVVNCRVYNCWNPGIMFMYIPGTVAAGNNIACGNGFGAGGGDINCISAPSVQDLNNNVCGVETGCGISCAACPSPIPTPPPGPTQTPVPTCDYDGTCQVWEDCECSDCDGLQDGCESGYVCGYGGCIICNHDSECGELEDCTCADCDGEQSGCDVGEVCGGGECVAGPTPTPTPECETDADCGIRQACQFGTCFWCSLNECPEGDCGGQNIYYCRPGVHCEYNTDCKSALAPLGSGQYCNQTTGVCTVCGPGTCPSGADCTSRGDAICASGSCVNTNPLCGSGFCVTRCS